MKISECINLITSVKKPGHYTSEKFWKDNGHLYFYNYILKKYSLKFLDGLKYFIAGHIQPNKCRCGKIIQIKLKNCSRACANGTPSTVESRTKKIRENFADPEIRKRINQKRGKTNIEKYGSTCYFASEKCKEKTKQMFIEKYGVEHNSQIPGHIEKVKKTNNMRYGVDFAILNTDIKKKLESTNLLRYGVKCVLQSPDVQEKIKYTNIEKYGVENVFASAKTRAKIASTNIERYGVENVFASAEIRSKITSTNIERYGVEHNSQTQKFKDALRKNNLKRIEDNPVFKNTEFMFNKDFIENNFLEGIYLNIQAMIDFFNIESRHCYRIADALDIEYEVKRMISSYEHEIVAFIKSISDTEIIQTYRNKLEIDIFLPEFNLGIEFNGLIYHGYCPGQYPCYDIPESVYKTKHSKKTTHFEERGIQVLQIFENEWLTNKELWKSVIRTKLGLNERVFARKCTVKEIQSKETRSFLEQNHLQGYTPAKINLGLFYQDELMSVMTFSKPRFNKAYDFELIRFCTKSGYTVVGAAAKLLSKFKSIHSGSIISYANRRWSNGNLYEKLGFELKDISSPNYFYFKAKQNVLHSRNEFQKHKLKDKLEIFDESLTEVQNMYNNGYWRIWDSGNKVYTL